VDDSEQRFGDALSYVRSNPARFFRDGTYSPVELASWLAREALLCGAAAVEIVQGGEWIVVHSAEDWLGAVADQAFRGIVPFPQAGPNAMRVEVLATAFSAEVITKVDGKLRQIRGNARPGVLGRYGNRGRAVAYSRR
jgi:hypothetical protein